MRIEETNYVIMRQGNMDIPNYETVFMSREGDNEFTNDILMAERYANRRTALEVKHHYDVKRNSIHESDVIIVPMKITYEW